MTPERQADGPLAGVRVLDLTSVFLGPYCTQMLGDMGADIVKIEPPGGDSTRYLGPSRSPGMSGTFLNINRNKRSLQLNLKADGAVAVLERLAASCDVMVHNMRPAAAKRLGIDYGWARAQNDTIIYCAAFGFGAGGRYSGQPAFDDSIQAISGIAGYQGLLSGQPAYCGTVVADKATGMMTANAILGALFARATTGKGQSVEVPMFETMVSFALAEHLFGAAFEPPLSPPIYPRVVSEYRRPYRTADGFLSVVPYTDRHWSAMFRVIDRQDLIDDPRFGDMAGRTENIDALYRILSEALTGKTTAQWQAALSDNDIPNVPVRDPKDLLDDPHLQDVGFFVEAVHPSEGAIRMTAPPVAFSSTPQAIRRVAPRLGQHSAEILKEFGFSDREVDALMAAGTVAGPAA